VRSEGWLAELCESYVCTCIHIHIDTNINTNTLGFVANPVAAVQKDSVNAVWWLCTHIRIDTHIDTHINTHTRGFVADPVAGVKKDGLQGFVRASSRGIVNAVCKPVVGTLTFAGGIAAGVFAVCRCHCPCCLRSIVGEVCCSVLLCVAP